MVLGSHVLAIVVTEQKHPSKMHFFGSDMNSGQQAEKLFFQFSGIPGSIFQII